MGNSKRPEGFPLFLHASGQWCKKIKGKFFYFGKDRDKAAERWLAEKDTLFAGKRPPRLTGAPTLKELANVFHDEMTKRVSIGKITQRHLDGCATTLERLISIVGGECPVEELRPLDFDDIYARLFEPKTRTKTARGGVAPKTVSKRSIITVDGDIRRILLFLRWCEAKKLVGTIDIGTDFKPSSKSDLRKHRAKQRKRIIPASDLLATLAQCSIGVKPLVFLGINAGLGAKDIAHLELDHLSELDEAECWVDLPRMKTGVARRFLLWPETVAAINAYLEVRPRSKFTADSKIVFLNRNGLRWVRSEESKHNDAAGDAFVVARKAAGVTHGTFYDLRRTFATVALETLDSYAVKLIMGHAEQSDDMTAVYNQKTSDARLKVVINHVRNWLFSSIKGAD